MIEVVNIKTYNGQSYYIGRPSALGNPYRIGIKYKRGETIDLYRKWLWREINKETSAAKTEFLRLAELSKKQNLKLGCFCKPNKCHGDIIKAAIEWRNNMALTDISIFDEENETRLSTTILKLNEQIGAFPDGIVVVKGVMGAGKTALALQLIENGGSTLFVSAEQSPTALLQRLVARKAKLNLNSIVNKRIPPEDLKAAVSFTTEGLPFLTLENGMNGIPSIEYIKNLIEGIREKDGSNKVMLVLDSINVVLEKSKNNYQGLSKIDLAKKFAVDLDDLCKELGVTCVVTVQDGKEAEIAEIFEFASDLALELAWDKEGRSDSAGVKKSKVSIFKNRTGRIGILFLSFNGDFQTFE